MRALVACVALLAVAVCGCGLDKPNPNGTIRSGNAGDASCPQGFVTRWGRCCPEGSTADQCPTSLDRDTTGSAYPPMNCHCPDGFMMNSSGLCCSQRAGDADIGCTGANRALPIDCICPAGYESRSGQCCPQDAGPECPPGRIGSPCTVNEECRLPIGARTPGLGASIGDPHDLAPICLRPQDFGTLPFHAPSGYCSVKNCQTNDDCGPGNVCINEPLLAPFCVRGCQIPMGATSASCPQTGDQQSCFPLPSSAGPVDVCFPDCTRDNSVCQGEWRCFSDLRSCADPCTVMADDTRCRLTLLWGYTHCDVDAGHCAH